MQVDGAAQRLETYRQYSHLLIRLEVDPQLFAKLDVSGIVQLTMLEAHRDFDKIDGKPNTELAAWLRRILANILRDEIRKLSAQVRDVHREVSLEAEFERSSARVEHWLSADESSPSLRRRCCCWNWHSGGKHVVIHGANRIMSDPSVRKKKPTSTRCRRSA